MLTILQPRALGLVTERRWVAVRPNKGEFNVAAEVVLVGVLWQLLDQIGGVGVHSVDCENCLEDRLEHCHRGCSYEI